MLLDLLRAFLIEGKPHRKTVPSKSNSRRRRQYRHVKIRHNGREKYYRVNKYGEVFEV